jgi:3-oxoacyl-[acyl-carrier protein] reductase
MGKLKDRVAVVTGASKGIGASIAKQLAAEGAAVVVNYASSKADAERMVGDIARDGGRAIAVQADVAQPAEVARLFAETKAKFGRLDVLVNNAGVYEFLPLEAVSEAHFHKHFDLNVLGLLIASKEAAALFGPEGGSIINISSVASALTLPQSSVYSATKAAVDAITSVLAKELGPRKIRVNAVNPGAIETEGAASVLQSEMFEQVVARTPLGRIGQPGDIGPVVAFLASDDARFITGETLTVSGGLH